MTDNRNSEADPALNETERATDGERDDMASGTVDDTAPREDPGDSVVRPSPENPDPGVAPPDEVEASKLGDFA